MLRCYWRMYILSSFTLTACSNPPLWPTICFYLGSRSSTCLKFDRERFNRSIRNLGCVWLTSVPSFILIAFSKYPQGPNVNTKPTSVTAKILWEAVRGSTLAENGSSDRDMSKSWLTCVPSFTLLGCSSKRPPSPNKKLNPPLRWKFSVETLCPNPRTRR